MGDATRGRSALADLGASVVAGLALAILELVLALVRWPEIATVDLGRLVAIALVVGAGIGALAGVLVASLFAIAPDQRPPRRAAGLALFAAIVARSSTRSRT